MKYLSPTSIRLFSDDPELFYLRYIAKNRQPREPQTLPMSIGSAFDAFVKSYLYGVCVGKGDGQFELRTLFEEQVEECNWDWAWENGKSLFEEYKRVGCLGDLMIELKQAVGEPRFEVTVNSEVEGVPLLGKPDVFFINKTGTRVVYDWKVNGYCGKALKSPMPGYVKLRDKGGVKAHKDCHLLLYKGVMINAATWLTGPWADQLTIYSWLLGEEVGSEGVVFGVDQICGGPRLRFATHRLRVQPEYQYRLLELVKHVWACVEENWIFRDLSQEDSVARGLLLEGEADFEGLDREDEMREIC